MSHKKLLLIDPYLDTMGGGERHILSIAQVLSHAKYDVTIAWHKDVTSEIKNILHISFSHDPQYAIEWNTLNSIERLRFMRRFDKILAITDGSYFFSPGPNTYIFCMVPQKKLYKMTTLNSIKTWNNTFIANSVFTRTHLTKWGIHASVLYPYVDDIFFTIPRQEKPHILVVGRFFPHLHNKRQDIAIEWFIDMKNRYKELNNTSLILAGSVAEKDEKYMAHLQHLAQGRTDIEFKINLSFEELLDEYSSAAMVWHCTGVGVNEDRHPEQVEHFGITPVEAMASGCVVAAYRAGGPAEMILHEKNGFLFSTKEELCTYTLRIMASKRERIQIGSTARAYAQKMFSYNRFASSVHRLFIDNDSHSA